LREKSGVDLATIVFSSLSGQPIFILLFIVVANTEIPLLATLRNHNLFGDRLEADWDCPVVASVRFGSLAVVR
jgi:hypothetical protein